MSGVATLKLRGSKRHFDEMAVDLPVQPQACSPNRYPFRPPPLKRGRCVTPSPLASTTPIRHPSPNSKNLFNQFNSSVPSSSKDSSNNNNSSINNRNNRSHNNNNNNNNLNKSSNNNTNNNSNTNPSSSSSSSPSTCTQHQQQHKSEQRNKHITKHDNDNENNSMKTSSSSSSSPSHSPPPSPKQHQQLKSNPVVVSSEDLAALARHLPRRLKRVFERLASGQVQNSEKLFTLTDLREIVNSVINEHDTKLKEQFTTTLNERLNEQFRDFTTFNEDYVSRQLRGTDVAYLS